MDYDAEEARRRRELEKAIKAQRKAEAKKAEVDRQARSALARLKATTASENWHRMRLRWLDRQKGYDGSMASARVWLRTLPFDQYLHLLAPYAAEMPRSSSLAIEVAAVRANLGLWNEKGEAFLLNEARKAYAEECARFAQWERDNPGKVGWRSKPATRKQRNLMLRTAAHLGIDAPARISCGDAHDWLQAQGGNLRLGSNGEGEGE